jgi:hypothetical protein
MRLSLFPLPEAQVVRTAATSNRTRKRHYVVAGSASFNDRLNVSCPSVQCRSLLNCPIVPLIYARNAGAAAANVIQNGFRHFEPDAKALQAGRDSAAQIMDAPRNERRSLRTG